MKYEVVACTSAPNTSNTSNYVSVYSIVYQLHLRLLSCSSLSIHGTLTSMFILHRTDILSYVSRYANFGFAGQRIRGLDDDEERR